MKAKRTIGWVWLIGMVLALLPPRAALAVGACTCGRFCDWRDFGCHMSPGAVGAPSSGAISAGGNGAFCPTCSRNHGMPQWWVDEPYLNLHVSDTPLFYATSSGQDMVFRFMYKQRYILPQPDECPNLYGVANSQTPRLGDPYTLHMRTFNSLAGGSFTNACWSHNWMMNIMFWDRSWERLTRWPNGTPPPPPVYSNSYEALVFRSEGGMYYFNVPFPSAYPYTITDPLSQSGFQPLSALHYPTINSPIADTNGIYWGLSAPSNSVPATNGFRLTYPDGSQDIFSLAFYLYGTPNINSLAPDTTAQALLTQRIDPHGRVTQLGYEYLSNFVNAYNSLDHYSAFRLRYVVDPDGRTNTFHYLTNSPAFAWQVTEVDDPYGRAATFSYEASGDGRLLSITDAATNSTSFTYSNYSGWLGTMTTPYGTNSFMYYQNPDASTTNGYSQRATYVIGPDGGHELFYYLHTNQYLSATETAPTNAANQHFDDGTAGSNHPQLSLRNTYHWDRRQFAVLSGTVSNQFATMGLPFGGSFTGALNALSGADYNKARLKHWLLGADGISITESLSSERDPSPDGGGLTPGQRTWYHYMQQSGSEPELEAGVQVDSVARLLADGTGQYTSYHYLVGGLVDYNYETYSLTNGAIGLRTNWFNYGTNLVDLISVSNAQGQAVNFGYNSYHQVNALTNALNQAAAFSYDDGFTHNLIGISLPSGESVTFNYHAPLIPRFDPMTNLTAMLTNIDLEPQGLLLDIVDRTNGLPLFVHTHGTSLGDLWLTNSWDSLDRLTGIVFPDGTTISNIFTILDLTASKDRLGNWTYLGYDLLEHLTSITNALTNVTQLSWCGCGALTSIIDALTNTATLSYDNQGRLTNVVSPDATENYQYDLSGRMTNAFDGSGRSWQRFYNNQGLVTLVSNALGVVGQTVYDALDRPVIKTDANDVTVTNTFDLLDRLTVRTWTDGISEGWLFATNGLIAHTNRDHKVTHYGRDGVGRLTSVTNANQEVVQYGYDAANRLISLTDALLHRTTWNRNEYGLVTNKVDARNHEILRLAYDANGQLTNRWLPQTGNTAYGYDLMGNLLSVAYSGATNNPTAGVIWTYDKLNRPLTMADALGTTVWTYLGGLLQSETGPWLSNTLTYAYSQGVRTNLALSSLSANFNFGYAYDAAWRMQSLASPVGSFGYTYAGILPLVRGISMPNFASVSNHFDSLGRMDFTGLQNYWGHALDGYGYSMDALGLRTNITRNLGLTTNSVAVGYDNIGQITSWSASELSGMPRMNEQLSWFYDAADNLHLRTNGGLVQTFSADRLNELTNLSLGGSLTINGATPAPATNVTVNGVTAQLYGDLTFASTNNLLVNGTNTFTIIAQNVYGLKVTNNLSLNLPTSTTLLSDTNGNLTTDSTRSFVYNGENQLTNVNVAGQWKVEFLYDGLGRRRIERDYAWQGGGWVPTNETRFIYDGMLPIQERDSNNVVQVTYTRGLDLSGSLGGAGGIGGLLARTDATNASAFYHEDGVGNVTALMDGNQNVVGRYLYDPFGRQLGQWGTMAPLNRMQFSSMPRLGTSGLIGFPFRAYDPSFARFTTHDPIGEAGGINLYGFVANSPINRVDPLGLSWYNPYSWIYDPDAFASYKPLPLPNNTPTAGSWIENPYGKNPGDILRDDIGWGIVKKEADAATWLIGAGEEKTLYESLNSAEKLGFFAKLWSKCKFWEKGPRQTGAGFFKGIPADAEYAAIRANSGDIAAIAKNTGIKPENIQNVKDHLFYNEHLLDRYVESGVPATTARFDSDLGIAQAWKRLEDGTYTPEDVQLLRHETAEAWYMRKYGPSYNAAHEAAEARFPAPQ